LRNCCKFLQLYTVFFLRARRLPNFASFRTFLAAVILFYMRGVRSTFIVDNNRVDDGWVQGGHIALTLIFSSLSLSLSLSARLVSPRSLHHLPSVRLYLSSTTIYGHRCRRVVITHLDDVMSARCAPNARSRARVYSSRDAPTD